MVTGSRFILRNPDIRANAIRFIERLPEGKTWKVEISEFRPTRSNQQNRYLFGVCYPTLIADAGLEGWTADDVHDYCLGEHFGWERLEGLGRTRVRPIRRSSKLSTTEFMDYIASVHKLAAEHGVYIPEPNEEMA